MDGPEVAGRPKGEVGRRMKERNGLVVAGQTGGGIAARAQEEHALEAKGMTEGKRDESENMLMVFTALRRGYIYGSR